MNIELNGEQYVIATDQSGRAMIKQGYVVRQSPAFRTQGVQQRSDDTSINRYIHAQYPLGMGWSEIRRDTGWGVGGMKDSNAWTALGPATLSKLDTTVTHSAPADHLVKIVHYKGEAIGLFEEDYASGAITDLVVREFDNGSTSWNNGGTVESGTTNAAGIRGFDMAVHKGGLFVLRNGAATFGAEADQQVFGISRATATGAASWSDVTGTGWPTSNSSNRYVETSIAQRNNFDDDMGRLLSFGNVLYAALYRSTGSTDGDDTIEIFQTVDADASSPIWTSVVVMASSSGPKGFFDWKDLHGNRAPVIVTADGMFSINEATRQVELIYQMDGDPNNGRASVVGNDGALYVGLGSGELIRLAIIAGNLDVIVVGPPGDGFVTSRQGHPNYLIKTNSRWLFVAYGGHASGLEGSIMMIDTSRVLTAPETKLAFMPWHHFYLESTDVDIIKIAYSLEDDSTPRLHFATDGSAASTVYFIREPLVNPTKSTTATYRALSTLRLPDDDLGDPQLTSMIIRALADTQNLTAGSGGSGGSSDEFITVLYGLERVADTTTTLGDFLSGVAALNFGGSSEGVAANKIGIRLNFDRGSTDTNRPLLYEFELQAHNVWLDKRWWSFTIDIEETANQSSPTKVQDTPIQETIITHLETVTESTTMVTFTTGRMTQTRVKVPNDLPPEFDLEVVGSSRSDVEGYRTGLVTMRVEEGR